MAGSMHFKLITISFIIFSVFVSHVNSQSDKCTPEESGTCIDKKKALPLKLIAIVSILSSSMIGVCLPLLSGAIPALSFNINLFVLVKAFAGGVILATGFMHVLPNSYDMLWSDCLKEGPWHEFPFTGFVAMLSAIVTLMVDSMATSWHSKKDRIGIKPGGGVNSDGSACPSAGVVSSKRCSYRAVTLLLELGIAVHSVVIGISLGVSNNTCTIKGLVAALCFHQIIEGIGLGSCILQAGNKFMKRATMVFFFSVTTPFGIAVGMAIAKTYKENSPTALITVGLLNASSAGLLIYMALVDLLAADFLGPELQGGILLQIKSYVAVLLGVCGMSFWLNGLDLFLIFNL